jgi:hypothetical protein
MVTPSTEELWFDLRNYLLKVNNIKILGFSS